MSQSRMLLSAFKVRAAMMIDDALWVAGGAGGVVQRDRIPFIGRRLPRVFGIAFGEECLVADVAERFPIRVVRIIDVDDQWAFVQECQRLFDRGGELAIGDERTRAAVAQHEGDGVGVKARVERVQHGAAHRHPEMRLVCRGDVGGHDGDRVVLADATPRQRRCETAAACVGLSPCESLHAVNDGRMIGMHVGGALEECQRRQWRVVGLVAVEARQIGAVAGHDVGSWPARSRIACTMASGVSRDRKWPATGTTRRS